MNPRKKLGLMLLALALAIIGIVYTLLSVYWYPAPYFRIEGADRVFIFLAAALLALGPLLTTYLYKPGKKGLWLDMTVVALLQLAALAWAVNILHQDKPWFMVFAVDRFNVLAARDVDFAEIRDPRYLAKPRQGPWLITANLPLDQQEYEALLDATLFGGEVDIEQRPKYWGDYAAGRAGVLARSVSREAVIAANPDSASAIDRAISRAGLSADEAGFVPVRGTHADFAVMVDRRNGDIIDAVEITNWF